MALPWLTEMLTELLGAPTTTACTHALLFLGTMFATHLLISWDRFFSNHAPSFQALSVLQIFFDLAHAVRLYWKERAYPRLQDFRFSFLLMALAIYSYSQYGVDWAAMLSNAAQASFIAVLTMMATAPKELDVIERAEQTNPSMLDVGAVSAQSMFTGYFNLVFVGRENDGAAPEAQRMRDRPLLQVSQESQDEIPASPCGTLASPELGTDYSGLPFLFVLIPMDANVPDAIDNSDDIRRHLPGLDPDELNIQTHLHIKPILRSRAGVKRRSYGKHKVYSLQLDADGPRVLFAMEWATAVSTLADMGMKRDDLDLQMKAFRHRMENLASDLVDSMVIVPIPTDKDAGKVLKEAVRRRYASYRETVTCPMGNTQQGSTISEHEAVAGAAE